MLSSNVTRLTIASLLRVIISPYFLSAHQDFLAELLARHAFRNASQDAGRRTIRGGIVSKVVGQNRSANSLLASGP
jgi:hypothetical protein